MFFVAFLRFLCGYVEFNGYGGFGERFINLCSVYDIPLWNLSYNNDSFHACTTINGYKKIIPVARNSGVRVRRNKTAGVPFLIHRFRSRVGLLIGALFFIVCVASLSGRVWVVDISGNINVPSDTILAAAQNAGLVIGTKTQNLNANQISLDTCSDIPQLSWAAVSIKGCCVYIDVTEGKSTKPIKHIDGYFNLTASKDAQLIILEPYCGTVQAKTFNPVLKGEILISGTAFNRDETVSFTKADGYAVGRTETILRTKTDLNLKTIQNVSLNKVFYLEFFGIKIPLGKPPQKYDKKFTHKQNISYNGKALPIGFSYDEYFLSQNSNEKINLNQAKLISLSDFMNEVYAFSDGKQVLSSDVKIADNSAEVTGKFVCYENIGVLSEFNIEETQTE